METIKVGIIVGDEEYGYALGDALKRSYSGFLIYLGQEDSGREADIIVYDDMRRKSTRCVYLAEKVSQIDEGKDVYYKYDSGKNLAGNILSAYSRMTGRRMIYSSKEGVLLIGVHSASGGSGCTSVSMALSQELQRFRGHKTLYLSFEDFIAADGRFSFGNGKGLKEFIYYILAEEEEKYSFMEEFLGSDDYGVETFNVFSGRNPLTSLSEKDFRRFFSVVFSAGRYDAIIFDCGNNICESSLCAMKIADKLLFLKGEQERDECCLGYLDRLADTYMEGKRISVINRYRELTENFQEGGEEGEELMPPEMTIAYDPLSFSQEHEKKSISLDTDFGMDVKNVLDLLRR